MNFHEMKRIADGRCGEVRFNKNDRQAVVTPACMLYTRGVAAPYLTNDLVKNFLDNYAGVHITLPTLFQNPGPDVLHTYGKRISDFLGVQEQHFVYMSVYDPTQEIQCSYNEDKTISVWNSSGRRKIDSEHFVEILKSFKPDIAQCLCDTAPADQTNKRNRKSVDRTLKFLDKILEYKENYDGFKSLNILGSIEGGDSVAERVRSSLETSKRGVEGFVIEGIDPSSLNWVKLLHTCIKNLPNDRPRFFTGPMKADDIFTAFECGIDVFDSSFAYEATQRGCALNFQCGRKRCKPELQYKTDVMKKCQNNGETKPRTENIIKDIGKTRHEINLANLRYKEDLSPLVIGCSCYSCTNHTRAYIYHLLDTKEMLAEVLLMIHNFHQYFTFFKTFRQALNDNAYDNFKHDFLCR